MTALEASSIDHCRSLKAFPIESGNIESLQRLNAVGLTVLKLPDSIGRVSKIDELRLSYSNNLETLPDAIWGLRSLKTLDISRCNKVEILPAQMWKIKTLDYLNASGAILLKKLPGIELAQIELSFQTLDVSETAITDLLQVLVSFQA